MFRFRRQRLALSCAGLVAAAAAMVVAFSSVASAAALFSDDLNAIAQVVYRESTLGAHIKSSPWTDMSGFSWRDARFFEYQNTGAGSTVTSDRPQLTSSQAAALTPQAYLAGSDGWNPIS
jgi:pectin methylesterase-like acyl-CoA thioesterase